MKISLLIFVFLAIYIGKQNVEAKPVAPAIPAIVAKTWHWAGPTIIGTITGAYQRSSAAEKRKEAAEYGLVRCGEGCRLGFNYGHCDIKVRRDEIASYECPNGQKKTQTF